MKKTILLLAVAAMCGAAQATILRVNNTTGSGAPYTTLNNALDAANDGDTIMVDGSATTYGNIEITKKLVIMGPGYWRTQNGITTEGTSPATIGTVSLSSAAKGTVLRGLWFTGTITVTTENVVINRCYLGNGVLLKETADCCILHSNFINKYVQGEAKTYATNTQLTNNIFVVDSYANRPLRYIDEAYIAYNTVAYDGREYDMMADCTNCKVEKNIMSKIGSIASCSYIDNCEYGSKIKPWTSDWKTDLLIKEKKLDADLQLSMNGKGAFAGDDPYVISGIPAGPNIEDITVPATVEQGNTLNVTIKLGVQK